MAVVCAALVILLSAFNGIESVIEKMYGKFDSDIIITHNKRKTFLSSEINPSIFKNEHIQRHSNSVEEIVVIQNDKKWANAKILGVEAEYLDMIEYSQNTLLEDPVCKENHNCLFNTLLGQEVFLAPGLIDKLEIRPNQTEISILAGKREMKIRQGQEMFNKSKVQCASVFNYNKEVNEEVILWSLEKAQELLGYKNEITHVLIQLKEGSDPEKVKLELKQVLGDDFNVKTNFEKNEMIYKTSKSERLMVIIIMVFVFVFAAINLIASLTIQYFEKQKDIISLTAIGFSNKQIEKVFILNGLLITITGLFFGLCFGYGICLIQQMTGAIGIGDANEGFPILFKISDLVFISMTVLILGLLFSWTTIKFISRHI